MVRIGGLGNIADVPWSVEEGPGGKNQLKRLYTMGEWSGLAASGISPMFRGQSKKEHSNIVSCT